MAFRRPLPVGASVFSAGGIQNRCNRTRPRPRHRDGGRPHLSTRVALALYWLGAALASAWILRDASALPWVTALAGLAALLLVPVGFAIALWPGRARLWLLYGLAPLAPRVER